LTGKIPTTKGISFYQYMEAELFGKLTRLKRILWQMSIADKVAFVTEIRNKLPSDALKTLDGTHVFSEENLLCVGLATLSVDNRDDFEHMAGMYGGGYKSDLRRGVYHGKGDIPGSPWRKDIRRLYRLIKEHAGDVQLPEVKEVPEDLVPANAWEMSKY
jgi:hypothetical protein